MLVGRRRHRGGRVVRKTQGRGGGGGERRGLVVDPDDRPERSLAGVGEYLLDAFPDIPEVDLHRPPAGVRLERLAAIRPDNDLDAEPMRRAHEVRGAIRRGRDQQKQSRHGSDPVPSRDIAGNGANVAC